MLDAGGLPVVNMFDIEPVVDPKDVAYEIMKRKYIFPFNTPSNPKFSTPLPDLEEAYRKSGVGDPVADAKKGGRKREGGERERGKGEKGSSVGDLTRWARGPANFLNKL